VSPNEVYHNPVDKENYVAPGGGKTYQPATPRPDQPERKVKVVQVRLLTSEADMADRTVVSEVAAFLGEAERLANVAFRGGRQTVPRHSAVHLHAGCPRDQASVSG
jgi:hypothetical protein